MQYTTNVYTSITPDLIQQWKALWDTSEHANIFNSPEWFELFVQTNPEASYQIHAVFEQKQLVAIFALSPTKVFGIRTLSPILHFYVLNTPFLTLSLEPKLLQALLANLQKENLYINKLDMPAVERVHRLFPAMFFTLISVNPYIDLAGDPFKYVSGNNLRDMKRVLRKYEANLKFETLTTPAQIKEFLPTMFEIDQKSAKQQRAMSIFTDPHNREVFTSFANHLAKYIQIGTLSYDNKPIAYTFSFLFKHTFLGYQASYLFDYRKVSPGKSIMFLIINSLRATPIKLFDFSGGVSSYKRDFTSKYYLQYNLYHSQNPLIMIWWKLINSARRLKQILFPLKNTRDHEFLFKTLSV